MGHESIPSIKDIAAIAGVSTATVSRILNRKGGYSAQTEARVMAVLRSKGYVVNLTAKALRESKTHTIGLVLPNIDNPFYSMLAFQIEAWLYKKGYSVLICNSSMSAEKEAAYFRVLFGKHVDGILCVSDLTHFPSELPLDLIPMVAVDRTPDPSFGIPCVVNDDRAAGRCATAHLIEQGCKNILLVSSHNTGQQLGSALRTLGYMDALQEAGIPLDKNYILKRKGCDAPAQEFEVLVRCFLEDRRFCPDGVLGTSEAAAIGALFALNSKGFSVPQQVKIATFDNTLQSLLTAPNLTAIDRNPEKIAQTACELLLRQVNGEKTEQLVHTVPFQLIVRQSSARL